MLYFLKRNINSFIVTADHKSAPIVSSFNIQSEKLQIVNLKTQSCSMSIFLYHPNEIQLALSEIKRKGGQRFGVNIYLFHKFFK